MQLLSPKTRKNLEAKHSKVSDLRLGLDLLVTVVVERCLKLANTIYSEQLMTIHINIHAKSNYFTGSDVISVFSATKPNGHRFSH